ncbi:MAG TPA: response regulator [Thermoanaerobaculia bacterium]|nr:response regulator [Thermoanaerobaculia bacterium]
MDKILIADDDPALRSLLRLVAQRAGFAVDLASNGHEAIEKIAANDYIIAVVDLMMPKMNGYELVDRIAKLKVRPAVLVVTAMTDTFLPRLDGNIVHSIIRKPFDIDMVTAVLTELAAAVRSSGSEGEESTGTGNVIEFRGPAC